MQDYLHELMLLPDAELAHIDPVALNLLVATGIPALAGLDVARYQRLADQWAADIRSRRPGRERVFRRSPQDWDNCVHQFRLGVVCHYVDHDLGIRYRPEQKLVAKFSTPTRRTCS
jgi:hypothetical protein